MFRVAAWLSEPQPYKLQHSSGPLQLQTNMSLGSVCVCVCVCVCVRVKKTERESVSTCCHHAFTVLKQLREETEEIRSELDE